MKLTNQQVGRAGEAFVVAEVHRRGGYATAFAGNMPAIDAFASDREQCRIVYLQIKTKTVGDWQTTTMRAARRTQVDNEDHFWVLVDIGKPAPEYFVVPQWWIQNWLFETTKETVARRLAQGSTSTHARIPPRAVESWRGAWQALGIFPPD
jgi:hypothetical protein